MTATIIISALNEQYLFNTLETLLARTPFELVDEIIVVDDCSAVPITRVDIPNSDKIRLVRNDVRKGLIWSRQYATSLAISPMIVSIDAHVKVQNDWLQPLLARLESVPNAIVIPMTCGLEPTTWSETSEFFSKTGWDWNLDFKWINDDGTDMTPAMAGHCFAFKKQWWAEIGGFDSEMFGWGGENIDLSLRSWLAGGSVQVVRNSAVAHWFKSKFNYDFSIATLERNKARIAEVWFDGYKDVFYRSLRKKAGDITFGDITERIKLRTRIQKHSMDWYIDEIQPDLAGIAQLKNKYANSRVAILGSSPSLDEVTRGMLDDYDLVVGINYNALVFDCDFVIFHDLKPAEIVFDSGKYDPSKLLIPKRLKIANGIKSVNIPDRMSQCSRYDLGRQDSGDPLSAKNPPFFHHASTAHTAIHFAAFVGAKSIALFGCGCKFASDGRSHTRLVTQYNNGHYWTHDEAADQYLARIARGYALLLPALKKWNISILKYEYL